MEIFSIVTRFYEILSSLCLGKVLAQNMHFVDWHIFHQNGGNCASKLLPI
jgi:hypothetical protein